jgi:hypothetical protein
MGAGTEVPASTKSVRHKAAWRGRRPRAGLSSIWVGRRGSWRQAGVRAPRKRPISSSGHFSARSWSFYICKYGDRKCGAATLAAATSPVALWHTLQRAGAGFSPHISGHFSARSQPGPSALKYHASSSSTRGSRASPPAFYPPPHRLRRPPSNRPWPRRPPWYPEFTTTARAKRRSQAFASTSQAFLSRATAGAPIRTQRPRRANVQ